MARNVFLSFAAAVIGVALVSAGVPAAGATPSELPPTPTISNPTPVKTPRIQPSGPCCSAERQLAEQQAQVLTGPQLVEQQTAAKAFLAKVAGDTGTTVCLTAQDILGLIISADRPAGAKPFTIEQKQQSCAAHLTGSHAAP